VLRRGSCPGSFFVFAIASSRIFIKFPIPIRIRTKRSPGCKPGLLSNYASQELGSAALTVVLFFVLTLSALLGRIILLLLAALLATLLTGLAALLTLPGLSTLLLLVHIVCHGYTPSNAAQALRIYLYL